MINLILYYDYIGVSNLLLKNEFIIFKKLCLL